MDAHQFSKVGLSARVSNRVVRIRKGAGSVQVFQSVEGINKVHCSLHCTDLSGCHKTLSLSSESSALLLDSRWLSVKDNAVHRATSFPLRTRAELFWLWKCWFFLSSSGPKPKVLPQFSLVLISMINLLTYPFQESVTEHPTCHFRPRPGDYFLWRLCSEQTHSFSFQSPVET